MGESGNKLIKANKSENYSTGCIEHKVFSGDSGAIS